jgi:hypothetical protein
VHANIRKGLDLAIAAGKLQKQALAEQILNSSVTAIEKSPTKGRLDESIL